VSKHACATDYRRLRAINYGTTGAGSGQRKLDQEPWYRKSEDYRAEVLRELPEIKRSVEEFGLKME